MTKEGSFIYDFTEECFDILFDDGNFYGGLLPDVPFAISKDGVSWSDVTLVCSMLVSALMFDVV